MTGDKLQNILAKLPDAKQTSPGQYQARCRAHDDRHASLSISTGQDYRVLLHCHAGCSPLSVAQAIGCRLADLMPPKNSGATPGGKIVAEYDYCDQHGELLYQVVRFQPKDFRQRRPDGKGGWIWNLAGVDRVLYRLPELLAADPSTPVLVVEGEKDVDNLYKLAALLDCAPWVATCNPGGAGKWDKLADVSALAGRTLVIIPDNDDPGRRHANEVALTPLVAAVRCLTLSADVKDVSDWIEASGGICQATAAKLSDLILTSPPFTPFEFKTASSTSVINTPETIPLGERDPDSGRLVLSPRRTLPTAKAFVGDFYTHASIRTLHSYAGAFWRWQHNRYVEIEDNGLRNQLQPWLHDALRYVTNRQTGEMELTDFESNPGTIDSALASVRSLAHLDASISMPAFLDGRTDMQARDVLPCRTINLHLPSDATFPATPTLFTGNALDFDYSPTAPTPLTWFRFLQQVWPTDGEQIETLQEWMGYVLTADTSQQKILLMVGPKRSGKGTIGRVIRRLIGEGNTVGPTTGSLAGPFGLQPLIGKSLAIVSDARFSGDGIQTVIERLLCISGEDTLTVDRKNIGSLTMKLPTRFMLLSNELPRLSDASGALAGRFIVLRLTESFYGREDTKLEDKLYAELPGILLWAIEGWKRLRERGRFEQASTVYDAVRELEDLSSPIGAFVRDRCMVGEEERDYVDVLYAAWRVWCEAEGRQGIGTKQNFCRELYAAIPSIRIKQGTQGRFYSGISLRAEQGTMYP